MRHPQSQDRATQRGGNRASPRQERGDRDGKDPPHHQPPGGGGGLAQARPWARPRPGRQAVTSAGKRQTAKRGPGQPAPPGLPGRGRAVLRAQPDLPAAPGITNRRQADSPMLGGRGAGEINGREAAFELMISGTRRSLGKRPSARAGGWSATAREGGQGPGARLNRHGVRSHAVTGPGSSAGQDAGPKGAGAEPSFRPPSKPNRHGVLSHAVSDPRIFGLARTPGRNGQGWPGMVAARHRSRHGAGWGRPRPRRPRFLGLAWTPGRNGQDAEGASSRHRNHPGTGCEATPCPADRRRRRVAPPASPPARLRGAGLGFKSALAHHQAIGIATLGREHPPTTRDRGTRHLDGNLVVGPALDSGRRIG